MDSGSTDGDGRAPELAPESTGPVDLRDIASRRPPQRSWLRDTPAGRLLFIVVVLGAAFALAKGCQARDVKVDQEEAIEIASQRIDFTPDLTQARFLKQGLRSRSSWFVSFATRNSEGLLLRCTVVQVDAKTGDLGEVREGGVGEC